MHGREYRPDRLRCPLRLRGRDIQMRAGPHPRRPRRADQDAALLPHCGHILGGPEFGIDFEPDEIRLDIRRIEMETRAIGNSLGDDPGVAVIFRQAFDVIVHGIKRRRGCNARLAHAAA